MIYCVVGIANFFDDANICRNYTFCAKFFIAFVYINLIFIFRFLLCFLLTKKYEFKFSTNFLKRSFGIHKMFMSKSNELYAQVKFESKVRCVTYLFQ